MFSPYVVSVPVSGAVIIGKDLFGKDVSIAFTPNAHGVILGSTGVGKTTLAKSIVVDLIRSGFRIIAIDCEWHWIEFCRRFGFDIIELDKVVFDPFCIRSSDELEVIHNFLIGTSLFNLSREDVLTLYDVCSKVFERNGAVSFNDVISYCPRYGGLRVLLKELEFFMRGKQIIDLDLLNKHILLQLPVGGDTEVHRFIIYLFLAQLFAKYMKFITDTPHTFVFIDEAHRLTRGASQFLVWALRTVRKHGFGLWLISQDPHSLDRETYSLTANAILLPGPRKYVDSLKAYFRLSDEDEELLLSHDRGYGIYIRQGVGSVRFRVKVHEEVLT